jgi:hypothetical protein
MSSQEQWLSNPYTSQPMLQSIEDRRPVVWSQPLGLPSQGLAHTAAPALSSIASTTTSETPSQTPFRTPQPRRIATPRRPSSQSQTPPSQASEAPVSLNKKQLTKDDHIHILRLAITYGAAWGHGTIAAFWQKIANEFEKTTGKKHQTLGRAVNDLVKARRKALVEEESGENDFESSYAMAIGGWISILDNHKAVLDARKEAQGLKDQETEESNN